MTKSDSPRIVEEVVRDGSYAVDFEFDETDLSNLFAGIDELDCVDVIDVGPGTGFGTTSPTPAPSDERYLEIVSDTLSETPITTILLPDVASDREVALLESYADLFDHVRIGVDITDVERANSLLKACGRLGADICLNLLKTYLATPTEAREAAQWGARNGADSVYVVDSAGGLVPQDVATYVKHLRTETDLTVGFHGHDNLGMGLQNALTAVDAGATYVDSSLQGVGRSAGNVQTELLLSHLDQEMLYTEWQSLQSLEQFVSSVYAGTDGTSVIEILFGLSKLHSSSEPALVDIADTHDTTLLSVLAFAARHGLATVEEVETQFTVTEEKQQ
jgi:isopropylmalate/homocitrate/citramalate synthase